MTKLCQLLAIEKGVRNNAQGRLTRYYRDVTKEPLLTGISRTYKPKDEEGDALPPESTNVKLHAEEVLKDLSTILAKMYDTVASKEASNCQAKADVVVGDTVILTGVPLGALLFLEKQLMDTHTVLEKLPILDPSEEWVWDSSVNSWSTLPSQTVKTKKVPRNHVRASATDKHPAQVDTYHEDVLVGTWTTRHFSGKLPADRVAELIQRVELLQQAVLQAREAANVMEIVEFPVGKAIFDYLLAP